MSACHTISPAAVSHDELFAECQRIKLDVRVIDEREDAVLEEVFCVACDHALFAKWRQYDMRWLGSITGKDVR